MSVRAVSKQESLGMEAEGGGMNLSRLGFLILHL